MDNKNPLIHIQRLADEEHKLYSQRLPLSDDESKRLNDILVELDQCWNRVRQRNARSGVAQARVYARSMVEKE